MTQHCAIASGSWRSTSSASPWMIVFFTRLLLPQPLFDLLKLSFLAFHQLFNALGHFLDMLADGADFPDNNRIPACLREHRDSDDAFNDDRQIAGTQIPPGECDAVVDCPNEDSYHGEGTQECPPSDDALDNPTEVFSVCERVSCDRISTSLFHIFQSRLFTSSTQSIMLDILPCIELKLSRL